MFGAYIHHRPLPTSKSDIQRVLAIAMLSQGYLGVPLYHHSSQVGSKFGQLASLVEWEWCHILMVEANIHLRLLHTFVLDIYKVFEQLLCCLKGICVHTLKPSHRPSCPQNSEFGILVHLWSENDAIANVMMEADIHLRPLHIHTWHIQSVWAIGMMPQGHMGAPLKHPTGQVVPRFGKSGVDLWSENDVIMSWLRLIFTSDHFNHPY